MLLIFTPQITNRIEYIIQFFFEELIPTPFKLTAEAHEFENYNGPKLNYSASSSNTFSIKPHALLLESHISPQNISLFTQNGKAAFFKTDDDFGFDLFAASFYLLSRYEEYLPFKADAHSRFAASESLAFKNNFLREPLINLWAADLKIALKAKYPTLAFGKNTYTFTPTYDIDHAYLFKNKSAFITFGSKIKDLLKLDFANLKLRSQVLSNKLPDPYNTFDYLNQLHQKDNLNAIFFFLLADRAKYDKPINYGNAALQKLINETNQSKSIGIHPSYESNTSYHLLETEVARLKNITGNTVELSRQHYLKLSLPKTYLNLIKAGIKNDYTMGYAGHAGFRASVAQSFPYFNLSKNEKTALRIHPFAIMDATYQFYKNNNTQQFLNDASSIIKKIKAVDGQFISLFHNSSFSEIGLNKGWQTAYEKMIALAV